MNIAQVKLQHDEMNTMRLRFVSGHRIEQRVYKFPHRCPGQRCAIGEWIKRQDARFVYTELPATKRSP